MNFDVENTELEIILSIAPFTLVRTLDNLQNAGMWCIANMHTAEAKVFLTSSYFLSLILEKSNILKEINTILSPAGKDITFYKSLSTVGLVHAIKISKGLDDKYKIPKRLRVTELELATSIAFSGESVDYSIAVKQFNQILHQLITVKTDTVLHNFFLDFSKIYNPFYDREEALISADSAFRDIFRGLRLSSNWCAAIELHSNYHHYNHYNQMRYYSECPRADDQFTVGMRVFVHYDEEPIGVAVRLYNNEPLFFTLSTASLEIRALSANFAIGPLNEVTLPAEAHEKLKSINTSLTANRNNRLGKLWDLFFNSEIICTHDNNGYYRGDYIKKTLHCFLQEKNIKNIDIAVMSDFHTLPLHSSYDKSNKKYAIEYYDIAYLPTWSKDSRSLENIEKLMQTFSFQESSNNCLFLSHDFSNEKNHSTLLFSNIEASISKKISKNYSNKNNVYATKDFSIKENKKYGFIHISTHTSDINLKNFSILLPTSSGVIDLPPEELINSELFRDASIILNACNTTSVDHTTNTEDYSLALSLITAKAKNVVSTNLEVDDYQAFRFGVRLSELYHKLSCDLRSAFRATCLEIIAGDLPFYEDKIDVEKYQIEMLLAEEQKSLNAPTQIWDKYIYWEQAKYG